MSYDALLLKGTTSKIIEVPMRSSTTGQLLTGLLHSGMTITYLREGAASVTVTPVSGTLNTFVSSGWVETATTGVYQFGVPNAALVTGADAVTLVFKAAGAIDKTVRIVLAGVDIQDAADFGLTNLTGHTPQTGDAFARIGADGAALTALGDARLANLDATVSSRSTLSAAQVNTEADTALADVGLTSTVTGRIDVAVSTRGTGDATLANQSTLLGRLTSGRAALLDNLDAAISTRLATIGYTAPANADIATLLTRLSAARALLLDDLSRLDVAISSRMATFAYTAPPTAAANASQVRTELATELSRLDVAVSSRGTGDATLANQAALIAYVDALEARLTAARALLLDNLINLDAPVSGISGGGGSGSGARSVTVIVTDGTDPLQNATVRLTEGVNSFVATTDADGEASFSLDDATYRLTVSKSGYSFTPTTVIVNGEEEFEAEMTAFAIPPASDPDKVSVVFRLSDFGTPRAGVNVSLTMNAQAPVALNGSFQFDRKVSGTTDADGECVLEVYPSSTLVAEGLSGTYRLSSTSVSLDVNLEVPDEGGLAADMIV